MSTRKGRPETSGAKPVAAATPEAMAIPAGRTMPREQRLTPPAWPGGRAAPPEREFQVSGKRNRKIAGLA